MKIIKILAGVVVAILILIVAAIIFYSIRGTSSIMYIEGDGPLGIDTMKTVIERENERNPERKKYFMKTVSNTLNGTVFYNYGPDSITKELKKLSITRYDDQKEFYRIFIKNDTIQLGDTFEGSVHLYDYSKLYIWDEKKGENILVNYPEDKPYIFKFTPTKKGIYTFKGLVEVNLKGKSKNHPFEYRYAVVD